MRRRQQTQTQQPTEVANQASKQQIQHVKSLTEFRPVLTNGGPVPQLKTPKKQLMPEESTSLLKACRSNSRLSAVGGYIKLDMGGISKFGEAITRYETSATKSGRGRDGGNNSREKGRQSAVFEPEIDDPSKKKPKFVRRNTDKKMQNYTSMRTSQTLKSGVGSPEFAEILQENTDLQRILQEKQFTIGELMKKIETMEPRIYIEKLRKAQISLKESQALMKVKNKEIEMLKGRVNSSQQQIRELSRKIQDLLKEQQIFKGNICGMSLDDSEINGDMVSTAEYIQSLTDLEDELHQRKAEIFDLNKMIEQLKIKQHFTETRHEQNLRRCNQQWEAKYKKLMQMYKTLKASTTETVNMQKNKTKTEYMAHEREDLFNLSLSTDRSQLFFN